MSRFCPGRRSGLSVASSSWIDIITFGIIAVKARREALVLTQEDLAEKARIHRTYLSDVERGMRNLARLNIERLANAMEMSLAVLFGVVELG